MRIVAKRKLREFWEKDRLAEIPLEVWYEIAKKAKWKNAQDIKKIYATASIITANRIVFNIKGNTFRLVVHIKFDLEIIYIKFDLEIIYIRFVGRHKDYDKIDVKTI